MKLWKGISLFAVALTLAACGNTSKIASDASAGNEAMLMTQSEAPDENATFEQLPTLTGAAVRVIHASPDAPAVDILVNDKVAIEDLAYTQVAGPAELPAGTPNLKVNAANTSTTVINVSPTLEANRRYSAFAVGKLAQIEPLLLEDTRFAAAKAAKVRILHASPSAPKVDVYLSRPGKDINGLAPVLENVPFKTASSYFRLRPGGLQVRVTPADSKTVVIDSGALEVSAGQILTVAAIDKAGEAGKFSAIVIDERKGTTPPPPPAPKSIVEIAVGDDRFTTLVGALKATDLVGALSGDGPFTVFAPTNDAFAKLASVPGGDALKSVLLYHVASGKVSSKELEKQGMVTTLQGAKVNASVQNGNLILNGNVKVIIKDIQASNGVIHVIDTVLIPPAPVKTGKVRAVHASSDAPAVNVLVDDKPAFSNVSFRQFSDYAPVPAGNRNVKVQVASNGATAINANLEIKADRAYTVIAVNKVAKIAPLVFDDTSEGHGAPANGKIKLRLIHAAAEPAANKVDVYITAPGADISHKHPNIGNFAFKASSGYLEVPAGSYQVRITLPHTKTVVIDTGAVSLAAGKVYTGIAVDPVPGSSAFGALLLGDN